MKIILVLLALAGCASSPRDELDENEFADEDLKCLERDFDNDRRTKC